MKYLFKFTPIEPYFFGNEKALTKYPEVNSKGSNTAIRQSSYFARSENTPSQSTILGAIRLMLLLDNGRCSTDYSKYSKGEEDLIGAESFNPDTSNAKFGCIESISPIFIIGPDGSKYIPLPHDHIFYKKENNHNEKNTVYMPFREYGKMCCADGEKLYSCEHDPKLVELYTYTCIDNCIKGGQIGRIEDKMISSSVRIGINRKDSERGFFKREYKRLKVENDIPDGHYSFAVICDLNCAPDKNGLFRKNGAESVDAAESTANGAKAGYPLKKIAHLGQTRSAFSVEITPYNGECIENRAKEFLKKTHASTAQSSKDYRLVYCLSDAFVTSEKYNDVLFAATETRDYRALLTIKEGNQLYKSKKLDVMYHMLKAGSVLIFKDGETAQRWIDAAKKGRESACRIGYNAFVTIPLNNADKEDK